VLIYITNSLNSSQEIIIMFRYPNGLVAVVVSDVSDYQKKFCAFDNNRRSTCLLGIDEFAVGFCCQSSTKSKERVGARVVLSKVGAIITDEDGNIQYEWKWDRRSRDAGTMPMNSVVIFLNDYLTFKMKDREEISLEFKADNVTHTFDLGMKQRRISTYLEKATRSPDGRIFPRIENLTLKDRQDQFGKEMAAQRNKVI